MGDLGQRRHQRSVTIFEGLVDSSDSSIHNNIVNISCSGILCVTDSPIPEMMKLNMILELPTAQTHLLEVEGTVVRCQPSEENPVEFTVAILFNDLSISAHDMINTYVEYDVAMNHE